MQERYTSTPNARRPPLFAREALLPMMVNMFLYLTFTSYTTFLPLYARTLGMGNAGWLYSTYAIALLSTRFLPVPELRDQYGRAAVILPGLSGSIRRTVGSGVCSEAKTLYAGVSLYGLGFGLAQPGLNAFAIDRLTPERARCRDEHL